jgi:hypothetical protein
MRLRLDLSAPLLTRLDLAAQARGLALRRAVSGYVVLVQALQPLLAAAHQTSHGARRLAAAGRTDATPASTVSTGIVRKQNAEPAGDQRNGRRRLAHPCVPGPFV